MLNRARLGTLALVLAVAAGISCASIRPNADPLAWQDSYTTRVEALALLQSLNADLLSHDSATLTLDKWCALHHLAGPSTITAERVRDVNKPATAAQRELLQVGANETLGYRRVRLHCGTHVLSEADNWYVPTRLTAAMNDALDHSDIAFGRAVQALQYHRRTLAVTLLWAPLPDGWEMGTPLPAERAATLTIPPFVLQHTAVLSLPDGRPISTVTETYTSEIFAFPQPAARR